jgi:hypothetical protein
VGGQPSPPRVSVVACSGISTLASARYLLHLDLRGWCSVEARMQKMRLLSPIQTTRLVDMRRRDAPGMRKQEKHEEYVIRTA